VDGPQTGQAGNAQPVGLIVCAGLDVPDPQWLRAKIAASWAGILTRLVSPV